MKFFVLIFVSMFLVNAKADDVIKDPAYIEYQKDKDAKSELKEDKKACDDAYKEYYDAKKEARSQAKEDKKDAEDKILELQKEKTKTMSDDQEDITAKDKELTDAQTTYKKAKDEVTEAQNALEEDTNKEADEKIRALQQDQAKYEKLTTTDMDSINNDYQNNLAGQYEKCKGAAEELFAARIGLDRQSNAKANQGLQKSGGATFATGSAIKKAKAEAKAQYSKCISETNRVLGAKRTTDIKNLLTEQKAAQQEIINKKTELDRLTNSQYTKKLTALQEKLNTAGLEYTNVQNQVNADKQRLMQKMVEDGRVIDQQIMVYRQRAGATDASASKSKKAPLTEDEQLDQEACMNAQSVCCEDKQPKYGSYKSFCSQPCGKTKKLKRYRRSGTSDGSK